MKDNEYNELYNRIQRNIKALSYENKNGSNNKYDYNRSNYKYFDKDPLIELQKNDIEGLKKRSQHISKLYESYVEYYKNKCDLNIKLKQSFFNFFMIFLAFIIIAIPIIILIISLICDLYDDELIAIVASSAASIITAIIIIPKIIAKYLFSTDEDTVISELLKEIQNNDIETRKGYSGDKNSSVQK